MLRRSVPILIDGLREATCSIITSSSGFHFSLEKYMKTTSRASKREKILNRPKVDPLLADCESYPMDRIHNSRHGVFHIIRELKVLKQRLRNAKTTTPSGR